MKILIADDDALVRMSLKTMLEAWGHDVVGEVEDGRGVLSAYLDHCPDIVLMDIRMPGMDGLEASRLILENCPQARILLLTTFQDEEYIIQALTIGVSGYLLKQNYEGLPAALSACMQGARVFNTEIVDQIPHLLQKRKLNQNVDMTDQEKEIMILVAQGYNNKEISQKMFLGEGTIRNYISRLLAKLELRDRTQLAVYYYQYIGGQK